MEPYPAIPTRRHGLSSASLTFWVTDASAQDFSLYSMRRALDRGYQYTDADGHWALPGLTLSAGTGSMGISVAR